MTAISATAQAATSTAPPSMLIQITGAPNPPTTAYTSNFTAGVDSWTNGGNATLTGNTTVSGTSVKTLRIQGPAGSLADATAQRALTGLTVGSAYRYRSSFVIARGEVKLVAKDTASGTVLAQTAFFTYADPSNKLISLSLDFTPTASAVTIQIVEHQTTAFGSSQADVYAYNISVQPLGTWQGTTVYRTDANGTDVVVREDPGGQDTSGGTMTLTDWEAALCGIVRYRVVDGSGGTANVVTSHAESRRNYITDPRLVTATGWTGVGASGGVTAGITQVYSPNQSAAVGDTWATGLEITAPAGASVSGTMGVAGTTAGAFGTNTRGATAFSVPAGTTARFTNVFTLTTGADGLRVLVTFGAATPAGVKIDRVTLEKASTAGAYFDGDSASVDAVARAWLGTANASASIETAEQVALGAWLTLPLTATPSAGASGAPKAVPLKLVTAYEGTAETTGGLFQVVGRSDKIGNPGPLATRAGQLEVFQVDYASARAVRSLLQNGDTAMLRQPTYGGVDMYLVASRVSESWQEEMTTPRHWGVSITYDEVVAP